MNASPKIKKLVSLFIGGVVLIILLIWLFHYLNTGKITVTTNDKYNTITLTKISDDDDDGDTPQSYKAHSRLSVSVSTGQYVISVVGNSIATTQVIKLGSRQSLSYNINPVETTGVEPVAYQSAQDLVADNDQLIYLNYTNGSIYKVDAQNNLTLLNQTEDFQNIKWSNTSFGVGQISSGQLYVINNGLVSLLKVPFSYDKSAIDFAVSPAKQIYVSHGADVYMGGPNGNFKEIYIASTSRPVLAATTNQVAVADGTFDEGVPENPLLATISASGKIIKKDIDLIQAFWSPNGQYLSVADESGTADIYTSSLDHVVTVPTPASSVVTHMLWLNNSTLFYSTNDQLWTYDLLDHKAEVLADMPLGSPITGMTLSDDGSYIYLTTVDSTASNNAAIRRVGLRGQQVDNFVYNLQDILPATLTDCSLSLINFKQPTTILVSPLPNSSLSDQADIQEAQTELQQDGFSLSELQFTINSTD